MHNFLFFIYLKNSNERYNGEMLLPISKNIGSTHIVPFLCHRDKGLTRVFQCLFVGLRNCVIVHTCLRAIDPGTYHTSAAPMEAETQQDRCA